MLRKDYIIRLTDEGSKFLAVLLGLRKEGKWDELEEVIRTSAQKYSGVEIEFAETLPDEKLPELLKKSYNLSNENLKLLGDLLYEKGLFYLNGSKNEDKANNAFYKAFLLFTHLKNNALESDFSLDMHYKFESIKQLLGLK